MHGSGILNFKNSQKYGMASLKFNDLENNAKWIGNQRISGARLFESGKPSLAALDFAVHQFAHPAPEAFALDVRGVADTQQPLIER